MDEQTLKEVASFTKDLQISSPLDEQMLITLYEQLATVNVNENISTIKGNSFSYEAGEAFSGETFSKDQLAKFQILAKKIPTTNSQKPTHRVFIRDTPIRSTQIKSSVPTWGAGAAVDKTIGPFISTDGRKLWYDFYPFEELVALYIQGDANPVLLFHKSIFERFFENLPFIGQSVTSYQLTGNTIWIYTQVLSKDAPANYYTGLRIKGGEINFTEAPQDVNEHITVNAGVTISVKLTLDQPPVTSADATSDYGKDARAATLNLPQQFNFSFDGSTSATAEMISNAHWNLYGSQAGFTWNADVPIFFDNSLNEILIPFTYSEQIFSIQNNLSSFNILSGDASVEWSAWALPITQIDINNPTLAEGIGALTIRCKTGFSSQWAGIQNGAVFLSNPYIQLGVGKISVLEFAAINLFGTQKLLLWKDDIIPERTSIDLFYNLAFPFLVLSEASGNEMIIAQTNTIVNIDRPVTVDAHALDIKTKNSLLFISATKTLRFVYLYDHNILADNAAYSIAYFPQPISFALENAVFKTTKTNGCLLFGDLGENFINVEKGNLYLSFGIYAYLPMLPDPYAVNLGVLKQQFSGYAEGGSSTGYNKSHNNIWLWLICYIKWIKETDILDEVKVSFFFAPLQQQSQVYHYSLLFDHNKNNNATVQPFIQNNSFINEFNFKEKKDISSGANVNVFSAQTFQTETHEEGLPDYQSMWNDQFGIYQKDLFALLDVSSHANQMGVSFQQFSSYKENGDQTGFDRVEMYKTFDIAVKTQNEFPLKVEGMNVVAKNIDVRAFTLPQVSWEPVFNLTKWQKPGDPPFFFNYYPDDGGATRLFNSSVQFVPIAPIPVTHHVVKAYHDEQDNKVAALFTLPFGLRASAILEKTNTNQAQKPSIHENRPSFGNNIVGGIQLKLTGGINEKNSKASNQFEGVTMQINNVLNIVGSSTNASTLGYDVTKIFNDEFFDKGGGVPLIRFDLSGYGASIFSNWFDKSAQFATTSQAEFEVFIGRTAHEVIQVRSVLYPWGIRVVRTITLFRTASGYEYRVDSGWKAESDGKFDFSFVPKVDDNSSADANQVAPYHIHPGVIKGLYNIKNITDATHQINPFKTSMDITKWYDYDGDGKILFPYNGGLNPVNVELDPVYFDADIDIENTMQGQVNGLIASKQILGFVQLAPTGIPLTPDALAQLLNYQQGSIGGPVNCIIDIGLNGQQMRLNRVDVNISTDKSNTDPVFVAAARGNTILPKEGSWSMVMHTAKTGNVTPLPQGVTVPLIRMGEIILDSSSNNLQWPDDSGLLRIANPTELLRMPTTDTINFGFLQSTNTQKALFLTPAYQKLIDLTKPGTLLSKTPPLFADAYRLMNSTGIFPNIGDAINNYGNAIALAQNFATNSATDAGKQLLELMQINQKDATGKLLNEGYKLLKQDITKEFDLSSIPPIYFVNTDALKIYTEYNADVRNDMPYSQDDDDGPDYSNAKYYQSENGKLNFDIDSFVDDTANKWLSKMSNISMSVDLGPFTKLVTINGNFNAQNGSNAAYAGNDDATENFPSLQLQFCKELNPVMDILQVLVTLQGGDYAAALKKGLQIAMSNDADSWNYKFEASQEIPLIDFPSNIIAGASAPLKLQASLKFGVYFNEALKVTTNPSQLLPTAGAFIEFYGKLSVMCVSLEIATVYAVGSVDLRLAADTSVGPSLTMKFGFGAQVVVGLPVVGNVSVLYMVGIGVYMDSQTQTVTASLLFQGRADLLGGIVDITITIEAQGGISRSNDKTICEAQVTFAIDISICFVIDIDFSKSWSEQRQIA